MQSRTGIVLVNWNGWRDTIECLESVFQLENFDGPVVVCDNASSDNSLEILKDWAEGLICAIPESTDLCIRDLVKRQGERIAISYELLKCRPNSDLIPTFNNTESSKNSPAKRLYLIDIGENLGFAGGNNVGIKLLKSLPEIDFFWLLNNDTVVTRDTLSTVENAHQISREPIIFGTTLLEYHKPELIQACGASFSRLTFAVRHLYEGKSIEAIKSMPEIVQADYPVGASLFVNRAFIDQVGLMSEDYFLYHEEIDWVLRDRWPSRAYIVPRAFVYHKCGASVGNDKNKPKSLTSDYYTLRGRIILSRKIGYFCYINSVFFSLYSLSKRLLRMNKFSCIFNAFNGIRDGYIGKLGKRY